MVKGMGTLTHLPTFTCQDVSPAGRPCVEAHGHTQVGLTHMDALGFEWADQGLDAGYHADPLVPSAGGLNEMAHAS